MSWPALRGPFSFELAHVLAEVFDEDGVLTGHEPTGEKILRYPAGESLNVRYEELLSLKEAAKFQS